MIAALMGDIPVMVDGAGNGAVFVVAIGRDMIGNHYVGGEGYQPCRSCYARPEQLTDIVIIEDPKTCLALQNWLNAIKDTDRLADGHSADTLAALDYEMLMRNSFVSFCHTNRLPRASQISEITPNFPPADECLLEEMDATKLHTAALAVSG